jgi:protein-disulfide isomerase
MTRIFAAALAPLFLVSALAAPAWAFDVTRMNDAERTAFQAEVRKYLLENPQVIMEAVAALEDRQAVEQAQGDAQLVQVNAQDIFQDAGSWAGGNLAGDLTLVEFVDYRCGYCRKAHDEVAELVAKDGNIRFVLKEFPILGEESMLASRFAIAVRQIAGDDAYKAMHDTLIARRGPISPQALAGLATDAGLDPLAVLARMDAPEVSAVIAANHELAGRLQINGTPTFVLGDQMLRGYVPLAGMTQLVAAARAK